MTEEVQQPQQQQQLDYGQVSPRLERVIESQRRRAAKKIEEQSTKDPKRHKSKKKGLPKSHLPKGYYAHHQPSDSDDGEDGKGAPFDSSSDSSTSYVREYASPPPPLNGNQQDNEVTASTINGLLQHLELGDGAPPAPPPVAEEEVFATPKGSEEEEGKGSSSYYTDDSCTPSPPKRGAAGIFTSSESESCSPSPPKHASAETSPSGSELESEPAVLFPTVPDIVIPKVSWGAWEPPQHHHQHKQQVRGPRHRYHPHPQQHAPKRRNWSVVDIRSACANESGSENQRLPFPNGHRQRRPPPDQRPNHHQSQHRLRHPHHHHSRNKPYAPPPIKKWKEEAKKKGESTWVPGTAHLIDYAKRYSELEAHLARSTMRLGERVQVELKSGLKLEVEKNSADHQYFSALAKEPFTHGYNLNNALVAVKKLAKRQVFVSTRQSTTQAENGRFTCEMVIDIPKHGLRKIMFSGSGETAVDAECACALRILRGLHRHGYIKEAALEMNSQKEILMEPWKAKGCVKMRAYIEGTSSATFNRLVDAVAEKLSGDGGKDEDWDRIPGGQSLGSLFGER